MRVNKLKYVNLNQKCCVTGKNKVYGNSKAQAPLEVFFNP